MGGRLHHDGVFPKLFFRAGAGLAMLTAFHAAADAIDRNALLQELQAIEDKQKQDTQTRLVSLAKQFMDASRSAATAEKVYLEALKNMQFDSNMRDNSRFQDWRKNHKGMLDNKAFQAALMLHLRYMGISLMVAAKPDDAPMPYKEIMDYLRDLLAVRAQFASSGLGGDDERALREFYEKPINEGIVAQGFLIGPDLQKVIQGGGGAGKWEQNAGNWRSILNLGVREPLRKLKDPQLLATWQFEIDVLRKSLDGNQNDVANVNFNQIELPRLMWAQAQDMVLLGQNGPAIVAMAQIVRSYPQHPDVLNWIGQLKEILKTLPAVQEPAAPQATPQ